MNAPFEDPLERTQLQSTLRKMGNSTGVILPKPVLEVLGLSAGEKVWLRVENGEVVIRSAARNVREGWEEAAARIGAMGLSEEDRAWLDCPNEFDDEWEW